MTDREAIDVLFNEWKCIDRNDGIHCDRKCESCDLVMDVGIIREAFNMAISALQAQEAKNSTESSSTHKALDTISRQEAIDYCYALINAENLSDPSDEWNYSQERINQTEVILHHLEFMPSAQPTLQPTCNELAKDICVPCKDSISRQDAINTITAYPHGYVWNVENMENMVYEIKNLPSSQPEIIHCKECEYGVQDEDERWYCRSFGCQVGDEDGSGFCADAERRTDEADYRKE